jgi:ABC-type sugar transport system permease subunit
MKSRNSERKGVRGQKPYLTMEKKHNLKGLIFVTPFILGFLMFFAYPMVSSLILSFSNIVNVETFRMKFTGLANYETALLVDTDFIPKLISSTWTTLINLVVILVFSLFMAVILNRKIAAKGFFRAAFFLPLIIGAGFVLDTILGRNMDANFQIMAGARSLNSGGLMSLQGIVISENLALLLGPEFAQIIQNALNVLSNALWISGVQTIIFLGALQSIPTSYYEAGFVDGATEWDKFWLITLPLVTPTILLNAVYTLIDSFTNIDNEVIRYTIDSAFNNFRYGFGSAMSWIYFIAISVVIGLVFLLFRKSIYYANS